MHRFFYYLYNSAKLSKSFIIDIFLVLGIGYSRNLVLSDSFIWVAFFVGKNKKC